MNSIEKKDNNKFIFKPSEINVINFIRTMKNLSGKTLIFYTFQQKKELEYNVIAYQAPQQPILIKDVIQQLPLNLSEGKYHFRFKSQFTEGNQKISGWIDINNLTAKVPLVAGSVYVKILNVKSNAHNKMFNLEKLSRVGLGIKTQAPKILKQKSPLKKTPVNANKQTPLVSNPAKKQQKPVQKPIPKTNIEQIDLMNPSNKQNEKSIQSKVTTISQQKVQVKVQVTKSQGSSDFLQFQQIKVFKNQETIEDKLKFFKQMMNAQQEQKQNQRIARDQLEQKINKWGYSGAKTINNLTTLLSTLHDIWPEWPQISLSELLKPESLAAQTKKAQIKTHPDKNRDKPFREKYLSKRVFELINEAKKASQK